MNKLVVTLLLSGLFLSVNAARLHHVHKQIETDNQTLPVRSNAVEASVMQESEAQVEEEVEDSDALKDPKKAKFYMEKAKEMMKLAKKEKQDGDKVEEFHYKNLALAYGMLSDGYKNGNQGMIDKGNKLLSQTKKQMGD